MQLLEQPTLSYLLSCICPTVSSETPFQRYTLRMQTSLGTLALLARLTFDHQFLGRLDDGSNRPCFRLT
ncbi:hypothetical protein HanPSC8_Chr08g0322481 [Helianthus annuus]|nr:hypothetical protein HanPSC8_Chr08g0322481 [Helianthus annuus]